MNDGGISIPMNVIKPSRIKGFSRNGNGNSVIAETEEEEEEPMLHKDNNSIEDVSSAQILDNKSDSSGYT